jgi:2,3-bisphosphoglycerate-dependent phosphoglycerate mutase
MANKYGQLILLRHTESRYNAKGKWCGTFDSSLSAKGKADARKFGVLLSDQTFDHIYVSQMKRSKQTFAEVLKTYGPTKADIRVTGAIDERDYGDYTGQNKWKMQKILGKKQFDAVRRGWDVPVPNGETLKDVYERMVPWYREVVLPKLRDGKTVFIVAHGNSNRALRKYIERVTDSGISKLEMDLSKVYIYSVDKGGYQIEREIREIDTRPTNKY